MARIEDHREILFAPLALRFALSATGATGAQLGLRPVPPDAVRVDPDGQGAVLDYGDRPPVETLALGAVELAALLIAYCGRARIPLPRKARKHI